MYYWEQRIPGLCKYIGPHESEVYFTGQNSKQDDHLVLEAIDRELPIHIFWRKRSGVEFKYLGIPENKKIDIIDEGLGDELMKIRVCTTFDQVVSCGRHEVSRFAWENGAVNTIGGLESMISGQSIQRCFIAMGP